MYDPSKPFKHKIKEIVRSTWENNPHVEVREDPCVLYPMVRSKHHGWEIDHTDGVGSKGICHWLARTWDAACRDALAMNINDLAIVGAKTYKAQVHLTLPEDDHDAIIAIMESLASQCRARNIAITGGETAVMNCSSFDLSLTVSGVLVDGYRKKLAEGDVLYGLPSNGPHSNGFTLLRKLFADQLGLPWLTWPTEIYDSLLHTHAPVSMMHITGGAYTKLKDILPDDCDAQLSFKVPEMPWLDVWNKLMNERLFFSTFNAGIGMIVGFNPVFNPDLVRKFGAWEVGKIVKGQKRVVISAGKPYGEVVL